MAKTGAAPRTQRAIWAHRLLWGFMPTSILTVQLIAKLTSAQLPKGKFGLNTLVQSALQPGFFLMAGVEFLSLIVWMIILAEIDLAQAFPVTALGYVLVVAAGWLFFHEPVSWLQIFGGMLILGGAALLGRPEAES